ncbi:L-threonylcarbamoyladenylate synthase [Metasolibacillus sp.]|uniref:L-threonylcarbamoyladenylate synthase n=1 Tax=Metasolibacillus sp. TaxID=2703680 RepID=UPI0025D0736E|nr:L-threonylcarbamoyladenylate synthase [Metasolibacillus sp.]MCT6923435.1 L-threonylcarbamoyladenylate synthase [Metasolibacillus sp.]MCT6939843.1 L-threonylcarbamoyladenylate synthase [Metasolibacillus sp.]
METKYLIVDKNVDSSSVYTQAVDFLNSGEVVAFPTETVYGLGAVATDEEAVQKIFTAKGRPSDNPLIVHLHNKEQAKEYVTAISEVAQKCMDAFWPGPLTLIIEAKPNVFAANVQAGLSTVGLRVPNHPVALRLLQEIKKPLAAPSANRSGKPSPTKAEHVAEDMTNRIACILDGGITGVGLESTVLDVTVTPPVILRPGGVTKEMLEKVIGTVIQPTNNEQGSTEAPKAPGMKYTHYAPEAPVVLIEPTIEKVQQAIEQLQAEGHRVALLASESFAESKANYFFTYGKDGNVEEMSVALYDALRACDKTDATIILATTTAHVGVGVAIMNRLEKAAGGAWHTNNSEN